MFNTYTSINISKEPKEHTVMFNIKRARVEYMYSNLTYVLFIYWTFVYINIAKMA